MAQIYEVAAIADAIAAATRSQLAVSASR